MNEFLAAIKSKLLDSALYNDVGGRCFLDMADDPNYPNVIYQIVTAVPWKTFSEHHYDITIQFSLRDAKSHGTTTLNTMYADLLALFDDCLLDISGWTLEWMRESNMLTMNEEVDALPDGTTTLMHRPVDFEVRINKI